MNKPLPSITLLGASGLIGEAVAAWLARDGFSVVPIARRFSTAQKAFFGAVAVECPIVAFDVAALGKVFTDNKVEIVVNCIGVLQDGPRGRTDTVHRAFVQRLVALLASSRAPALLIHVSIPGDSADDRTSFSLTKREGERAIATGSIPFVILRPGFVVAPTAYGSSALIRALAMQPFDLPVHDARRPLRATDVTDIARTIAFVARRWGDGERRWNMIWEVMAREPSTVGGVIDAFRRRLGGPMGWMALPSWLLTLGGRIGDLASHLGWSPPIRSTALAEMRRGVTGNPDTWVAATGIEPVSLTGALQGLPANVQEKWFARLYLIKVLVLASLVVFWTVSGLMALTLAFEPATAILTSHGIRSPLATAITIVSSLADILVGFGIAVKKTCRITLVAGICLSIFYMMGAAVMTPDLWFEPLGALIKTIPAIVLMLVALAILDDR